MEPIGVAELAREAGVSKPSASKFLAPPERNTSRKRRMPFLVATLERLEAAFERLGGTIVDGVPRQPNE